MSDGHNLTGFIQENAKAVQNAALGINSCPRFHKSSGSRDTSNGPWSISYSQSRVVSRSTHETANKQWKWYPLFAHSFQNQLHQIIPAVALLRRERDDGTCPAYSRSSPDGLQIGLQLALFQLIHFVGNDHKGQPLSKNHRAMVMSLFWMAVVHDQHTQVDAVCCEVIPPSACPMFFSWDTWA